MSNFSLKTWSWLCFTPVTITAPPPTKKSQLLLTWFWPKFKRWFLGTSRKDSYCRCDICPGNVCPREICPYQEYFSCYSPEFYETLKVSSWKHLEQIPTVTGTFVQASFVLATFVHVRNISAVSASILIKL